MGLTGVVVGIDGGGSKTDAVAATPAGEIVARRRIGTTSPHLIGVDASAKLVVDVVTEVCGASVTSAPAAWFSATTCHSDALPSGGVAALGSALGTMKAMPFGSLVSCRLTAATDIGSPRS